MINFMRLLFLKVKNKIYLNALVKVKTFINSLSFSFIISWKASKVLFIIRVFLELISAGVPIVMAFIGRDVINTLATMMQKNRDFNPSLHHFTWLLFYIFILQTISAAIAKVQEMSASAHRDLIENHVNLQIMKKSIALDISYFDAPKFYNELVNAKNDSQALQTLTWSGISVLKSLIQIFSSAAILFGLFWAIPILLGSLYIPSILTQKKFTNVIYSWTRGQTSEQRKMGYLNNILTSKVFSKDIRLFNVSGELLNRYSNIWKKWFSEKIRITIKNGLWTTIASLIPQIGILLVTFFVGTKIIYGNLTIGDYGLYTGMVSQLTGSLLMLITSISMIYDNNLRISHYSEFLGWRPNEIPSGKLKPKLQPSIEFINVSFKYPGTDTYILNELNLYIPSGKKVALIGLNGAGKSTIIKLILRFYEPTKGKILIDGINVHKYDVNEIRKIFSVMFQDYTNYAFTAREGIAFSDLENSKDELRMRYACRMSGVDKLSEKWKKGIDSYLTKTFEDDGEELSGGEWQKVAIARSFFHNGGIVILDEPTSSLDAEAEHKIFSHFTELCKDKGAIFISHRMSSVTMCDIIFVLDGGRIIECGTHKELLEIEGKYAYLFNLQAEKYRV